MKKAIATMSSDGSTAGCHGRRAEELEPPVLVRRQFKEIQQSCLQINLGLAVQSPRLEADRDDKQYGDGKAQNCGRTEPSPLCCAIKGILYSETNSRRR
ncbi:MAG: hypothetical protein MK129_03200 [SAR116 cluster bacterium]|nr:hypothetical protein [SAR116 cluster bacterium]